MRQAGVASDAPSSWSLFAEQTSVSRMPEAERCFHIEQSSASKHGIDSNCPTDLHALIFVAKPRE
jgi:hypothetical protein